MSYQLTKSSGVVEAVIDDNCGMKKFYSIANLLSTELRVKFTAKSDEFHSTDWTFLYKGHPLKLHYNIYNGVSISPDNSRANAVVKELATILEKKYF
ncbi:hypothetical protein EXU57_17890 [Segetibacter sp. 3557_3]|uniref:hypothetical protein n=1 Tax=Segetibacter sp. 3557_3 TaxID=2547429 RepID=UPI001058EBB9|nr:hypothetical protein [Segetibacter sp. 3557_3]TDH23343.1 hypothetical protein EXU57_17890 [Segetibacter sp. 3557_3]